MRDIVQLLSVLSLIGRGSHRISEIAGRLGKQATSISRPVSRLQELGHVWEDLVRTSIPRMIIVVLNTPH